MYIKILVATHMQHEIPNDSMYIPIQVGKLINKIDLGYVGDDTGENISHKNPYYSELTALYWGWKNLDSDFVGLVHYRRYLGVRKSSKNKSDSFITYDEATNLCLTHDIIVPQKRKYYIETLRSHYKHTHDISHLEKTREIISKFHPEYLSAFDKVMNRTWGHMFNMFIMKKELMNEYCEWLFDILFKLEDTIDIKEMNAFDARYLGRVSELIFDVWIEKNKFPYKEIKMIQLGNVNWTKKIISFLGAKFLKTSYSQSR